MTRSRLFIGGMWRDAAGGRVYPDLNPYDGSVFAEAAAAGHDDAAAAIAAAKAAFPAWAALPPPKKSAIFLRAAEILEARGEEVRRALTAETGATQSFARFQVKHSIDSLKLAAGWTYLPVGEVLPSVVPGRFAFTVRHPLGVVFGITPWNGAHILAWRTVLTPLAFGNTLVLKPSEEAPVAAGVLVAEIMAAAGLPAGVLNLVTNAPGAIGPVADAVFESPDVRLVMFTGSAPTARRLAARAGETLKRTVLELGGYNPLIVLADADLDRAVAAATYAAFAHQGQICMNARKIIVEESRAAEFTDRFVASAAALKIGDPADPETFIGPLITDRSADEVERRVREAVADGARVLTGGTRDGRLFAPTVLADVPRAASASHEEIFGPVVVVDPVHDAEEAIAVANATRYGLSAGILTGSRDRGLAIAARIEAGMIQVNDQTIAGELSFPNGGVKDSGRGYTGPAGMHDFTEIRQTIAQNAIGLIRS
jgi:acyl-CoA reductase-like NAD-dependent aldehyde dehydrogenase